MKYKGACHCKKVTYEVETELTQIISCNCSHCQIKALLLNFVPADNFTLVTGGDNLTTYHFNKKVIDHLFCKTCGVEPFARGKNKDGVSTISINVRCLDGVDIDGLPVTKVDGKNW